MNIPHKMFQSNLVDSYTFQLLPYVDPGQLQYQHQDERKATWERC
jgi:hypothetical protein